MLSARTIAICVLGVVVAAGGVEAQAPSRDFSQYRSFSLGGDLAAVSAAAGVNATEARLLHQRPALLQELVWRPTRWRVGVGTASTDPMEQIQFSFYNDQLFRIVVEYAADRTEGMTDADMIDAVSDSYGPALVRGSREAAAVVSSPASEGRTAIASWGTGAHGLVLYRAASYGAPMRLVMTDSRLDGLARKAQTESVRLDDLEAPQREIARQQKARDDNAAAAEKARVTNKAVFKP